MQRKIFRFFSGGSPHHLSKNCENFLSILRFSRGKKYFFQSCSKWCQKLKKNRLYFSIQFFFFLDCTLPLCSFSIVLTISMHLCLSCQKGHVTVSHWSETSDFLVLRLGRGLRSQLGASLPPMLCPAVWSAPCWRPGVGCFTTTKQTRSVPRLR